MSARHTQVYGWTEFKGGKQMRVIVRAASFAAVCRAALAAGLYKPRKNYMAASGNANDIAATEGREGVVLWRPLDDWNGVYEVIDANDEEPDAKGRREEEFDA